MPLSPPPPPPVGARQLHGLDTNVVPRLTEAGLSAFWRAHKNYHLERSGGYRGGGGPASGGEMTSTTTGRTITTTSRTITSGGAVHERIGAMGRPHPSPSQLGVGGGASGADAPWGYHNQYRIGVDIAAVTEDPEAPDPECEEDVLVRKGWHVGKDTVDWVAGDVLVEFLKEWDQQDLDWEGDGEEAEKEGGNDDGQEGLALVEKVVLELLQIRA
ncbi:uncharacterized protein EV422DRAFT_98239 [Fimicolochytrium jonesii]|uniref:uncharacterized protein n=1 Tax=Fimicolochytrium jonesii TaxID=1396493 RepID=UPI0022FDDA92|nr:uncharacterized protein EV422DRAFT_98239 [Fimicolochytrium jonesii]KAI8819590.1 hypothetical protein EV422DRAFT_98239 [Fimicolochytrium jonesii]